MLLRAFVLTFFGIIVCAGLVTGFVALAVYSLVEGPPLSRGDWIGGSVFVLLSAAVLAVSFTASMRTREQGGKGALAALARLAPVLMLVGALGGLAFARSIRAGFDRSLRWTVELACEAPGLWKLDTASCPAKAEACLRHAWTQPAPDDAAVTPLWALVNEGLKSSDAATARLASQLASDLNRRSDVADHQKGMYLCLLRGGP